MFLISMDFVSGFSVNPCVGIRIEVIGFFGRCIRCEIIGNETSHVWRFYPKEFFLNLTFRAFPTLEEVVPHRLRF